MISQFRKKIVTGGILAIAITLLVGCSTLTNTQTNPDIARPSPIPSQMTQSNQATPSLSVESSKDSSSTPEAAEEEQSIDKKVEMYLDKLKDKNFTDTYGDGYTWYTAAEELGVIGKPAVPGLIKKLDTTDDYERALTLYALLLATQHEDVNAFTNGEYINVNLDFNSDNHPAMVEEAKKWWDKYKNNF